jgi:hypothetical protein
VGNKIGKDKMKNGCSFPRIIPAYACIQLLWESVRKES